MLLGDCVCVSDGVRVWVWLAVAVGLAVCVWLKLCVPLGVCVSVSDCDGVGEQRRLRAPSWMPGKDPSVTHVAPWSVDTTAACAMPSPRVGTPLLLLVTSYHETPTEAFNTNMWNVDTIVSARKSPGIGRFTKSGVDNTIVV